MKFYISSLGQTGEKRVLIRIEGSISQQKTFRGDWAVRDKEVSTAEKRWFYA